MAPRKSSDRIRRIVEECQSSTDMACIDSAKRMSEVISTTRQLDVVDELMRLRLSARKLLGQVETRC
jgi:hypothetical protein